MQSKQPIANSRLTIFDASICRAMLVCALGTGIFSGCSVNSDASLESLGNSLPDATNALTKASYEPLDSVPDVELDPIIGKLVSKAEIPSPGRINAFELSGEYHTETTIQDSKVKREIFIAGFVEVDKPSVMLSIDGRTQTLLVGETFERITILEIAPPRARLSCDGVSWNASIFDRRSSSTEASNKKKLLEPTR